MEREQVLYQANILRPSHALKDAARKVDKAALDLKAHEASLRNAAADSDQNARRVLQMNVTNAETHLTNAEAVFDQLFRLALQDKHALDTRRREAARHQEYKKETTQLVKRIDGLSKDHENIIKHDGSTYNKAVDELIKPSLEHETEFFNILIAGPMADIQDPSPTDAALIHDLIHMTSAMRERKNKLELSARKYLLPTPSPSPSPPTPSPSPSASASPSPLLVYPR